MLRALVLVLAAVVAGCLLCAASAQVGYSQARPFNHSNVVVP